MAKLTGTGVVAAWMLALPTLVLAAGCASDGGFAERDSALSACAVQYREYRNQAPAPSGMTDRERGRYQDATRDYHVSRGCQRDAEATHTAPIWPRPPRK